MKGRLLWNRDRRIHAQQAVDQRHGFGPAILAKRQPGENHRQVGRRDSFLQQLIDDQDGRLGLAICFQSRGKRKGKRSITRLKFDGAAGMFHRRLNLSIARSTRPSSPWAWAKSAFSRIARSKACRADS